MSQLARRVTTVIATLLLAITVNMGGVMSHSVAATPNFNWCLIISPQLCEGDFIPRVPNNDKATAECSPEGVLVTVYNEGNTTGGAEVNGQWLESIPAGGSGQVTVPFNEGQHSANVQVVVNEEDTIFDQPIDCNASIPADPSQVDVCGTNADTYSVVQATGLVYKVNGQVLSGNGPFPTNGALSVTITAEATTGYTLANGPHSWTYDFTNTVCQPGKGSIKPVVMTLPDTASKTSNVEAFGALTAAAAAGMVVRKAYRRDLFSKK